MKRRELLRGAGLAAVATGLAACGARPEGAAEGGPTASTERLQWKMVTSWPTNFPGLGTGAARLAEMITAASGGRLSVKVYGAGELVPAFEVFDAVSRGTAEMGHSASYYWKGKAAAAPFFCAVPFGLNAQEMNGWLYEGGGLELWRELYAPFGLVPFPAGNTGVHTVLVAMQAVEEGLIQLDIVIHLNQDGFEVVRQVAQIGQTCQACTAFKGVQ